MHNDQERIMSSNEATYLPIYTSTTLRLMSIRERERKHQIKIIRNIILALLATFVVGVTCFALYIKFIDEPELKLEKLSAIDKKLTEEVDELMKKLKDTLTTPKVDLTDKDYDDPESEDPPQFAKLSTDPRRSSFNHQFCGVTTTTLKVQHGNIATINQFPFVAALFYLNKTSGKFTFRCGGSLISENLVLTAAHCLVMEPDIELHFVRLGELDFETAPDCDENNICTDPVQDIYSNDLSYTIHPQFNSSTKQNDIALIHLKVKAKVEQKNIKTICLPFDEPQVPKQQILTGFGNIEFYMINTQLRFASMKVVPNEKCEEDYLKHNISMKFTESQFCALGNVTKLSRNVTKLYDVDSCQGDSGSPTHEPKNIDGVVRAVQYGIVSGGLGKICGRSTAPGYYVKVSSYLDWILDNQEGKMERYVSEVTRNGSEKVYESYFIVLFVMLGNVVAMLRG